MGPDGNPLSLRVCACEAQPRTPHPTGLGYPAPAKLSLCPTSVTPLEGDYPGLDWHSPIVEHPSPGTIPGRRTWLMRRFALGSMFGGAAWHFGWEIVRAWLYEQGFHVVNPYLFGIPLSAILHYGVTAALVGLGLWLFWKTREKSVTGESAPAAKPALRLSLFGGYVFTPNEAPGFTGLVLGASIWNIGAPSAAIEWSLTIKTKTKSPVGAQFTVAPKKLTSKRQIVMRASESLDKKAKQAITGIDPIPGKLLFYTDKLTEAEVLNASTILELGVTDILGKKFVVQQKMSEWLQRSNKTEGQHP